MPWDPSHYMRFADERTRPGIELISRIPDFEPVSVVDLGSGTGHLTALLAARWRGASVVGIDSSKEMVDRALTGHPDIKWVVGDIREWEPTEAVDLIFSNATLHWLDDHESLFRKLRSHLTDRGVIAVQMPDNWGAPTHRVPADVLDHGDWPESARSALLRDPLAAPDAYRRWLQPADVDLWRTTYYQQLTGDDPVWNWVTGSLLRPVLAALDNPERNRFSEECRALYNEAYPAGPDGVTTLAFSRLFIIARGVPRTA